MKKTLFSIAASSILLSACAAAPAVVPQATPAPTSVTQASPVPTSSPDATNAKKFTVKGLNFSFDVKEIKVKKGDTVQIVFKNTEGMHDWRVDEFSAATKKIKQGEEDTITFVADKAGTFEYYCSVGQHRAMGMKGKLIVE